MQEDESQSDNDDCGGGLSTFTFLNFAMASISIAANLLSNSNSNSNNNNNNNNNNNKNDNNINIGNNNNNVNSQNVIMFMPPVGKKRRRRRSIFANTQKFCESDDPIPNWMKQLVIQTLDFFLRLENCSKSKSVHQLECKKNEISIEKTRLSSMQDSDRKFVLEHLLIGTSKISGIDF